MTLALGITLKMQKILKVLQRRIWSLLRRKNKISKVVGQYHTALEHTFLWIVDAEEAHLLTDFCVEAKLAKINDLKIVPMIIFNEGAVPGLKKIHSL
ncbi:MAG: hypothetical protein IH856_18725 [Deltaproteobacteria bacterium]|nr:hypothetical protein [Deltaproteobacteria bacterium]